MECEISVNYLIFIYTNFVIVVIELTCVSLLGLVSWLIRETVWVLVGSLEAGDTTFGLVLLWLVDATDVFVL